MATVTGLTAQRMLAIVNASVESASIQGSALVFTRHDGSSFSAGDFGQFIGGNVSTAVAAAVPPAVAGGVTALGNLSGAVTFPGLTPAQMINRLFTATLTGNVTLNASAFPTTPVPATQFAIVFKQDATGSRTLTLTGIKKSQGILALSVAPNAIDIISFMYDGTNWYAGAMGVNFL